MSSSPANITTLKEFIENTKEPSPATISELLASVRSLIDRSKIYRHVCACGHREFKFDDIRFDDPPRRRRYTCGSCGTLNEFHVPEYVGLGG